MRVPDGVEYYPAGSRMPEPLDELVREYAYQWGETYASYLAVDSGWDTIWCRGRRGVVRFVRWAGRYTMVVTGLLAAPEDQEVLLADFLRFAGANRLHVSFYNIGRDQLGLFRRYGFQVTKFGEEPVIRLDKATWQGKDYQWIRRQENYCKRQGVELEEVRADPADRFYREEVAPELEAISREHIGATLHGEEMRYFVGRFDAMGFGRRRLFVARRAGRVEAFIVCNPCLAGTMWAVEMYRRRANATRGVVPFTILQAMRLLQKEGVAYCSLSLIPFLRCERAVKGDSWIARPSFVFFWRHLTWIFDFRGIYHFKSRFRPDYREMYLVARPKATVLSMFAVGFTWRLFCFSIWRLARHGRIKSKKMDSRKSLAEPDYRRRVLRRLKRGEGPDGGSPASLSGTAPREASGTCQTETVDAR